MLISEKIGRRGFLKYTGAATTGLATLSGFAFQSRVLPVVLLGFAGVMLYVAYLTTLPRIVTVEYHPGENPLPEPVKTGVVSVEEALLRRRSVREYTGEPLTLQDLGQLLWAAQGITEPRWGFRAAPSAGGTYPLEVYIVVASGGVEDMQPGVYRYIPQRHSVVLMAEGDFRGDLAVAALDQKWVAKAPVCFIVAAVYERTTGKYGERGVRYVHMEAGHVGQNIYLQAVALSLGTVVIGAFHDDQVQRVVGMAESERPLYLLPIGHPLCEKYNDPRCIWP